MIWDPPHVRGSREGADGDGDLDRTRSPTFWALGGLHQDSDSVLTAELEVGRHAE